MSAWEMIWEFKRDIYCSENGKSIASCKDLFNPRVRSFIQSYLDAQRIHPEEDSLDEYSHFFSLAYRSESDRRAYDQKRRNQIFSPGACTNGFHAPPIGEHSKIALLNRP
ncbi:MAG TPA: hypothetical protein VIF37_13915 [Methylobacter sp.]|jgi:hypothetical protein